MPWQAGDRDPQPAHGSPQLEAVALHADRTGDRTGDRSGDGTGDGTGEGTGDRTSLNVRLNGTSDLRNQREERASSAERCH
eukprot:7819469-Pyramimonas_sp.AAC.1